MLGPMIATMHNLSFYTRLAREARKQILSNNFAAWKRDTMSKVKQRL
jgi:queuine tRNA-ribosyltransferase